MAVVTASGGVLYSGCLNGTVFDTPLRISLQSPLVCRQVALGRKHILALMQGGFVLSWGNGHFGQLGHGDDSRWVTNHRRL